MTHSNRTRRLAAAALSAALALSSCSYLEESDTAMAPAVDDGTGIAAAPIEAAPIAGAVNQTPGAGVSATLGRASWTSGYFQGEIFRQLLGELGYDAGDPAANELPVDELIDGIAAGDIDLTANGWFPSHLPQLERVGPTGELNLNSAIPLGFEVKAGALQGFLADKATIDAHAIESLDQIAGDPALIELFDRDGNGKADVVGCDDGWGCNTIIGETIEVNGWSDVMEQVVGSYNELLGDVVERQKAGESVLYYTWTPNASVALLVPGVDVMWLDVTPLPEQAGAADLAPGTCTTSPCDMGFPPNDIRVIANSDFIAENPSALVLMQNVAIPLDDISSQNLLMVNGADSPEDVATQATEWITTNRATVDGWLDAARNT